jgi:hypothetical protein
MVLGVILFRLRLSYGRRIGGVLEACDATATFLGEAA